MRSGGSDVVETIASDHVRNRCWSEAGTPSSPARCSPRRPASFSSAHLSATPRAQKKICFLMKLPDSAFSSTRAYIFS